MAELLPLAVASAFWPVLLAVVLVSVRTPNPVGLMLSFLVAGLLTTVTVGLLVIYALKGSSLTSGDRSWFGPVVEIVIGCVALLGALYLRHRHTHRDPNPAPAGPGRIERTLRRGVRLAFVAGVVLNVIPGVIPLVALANIAEYDRGFVATFLLVLGFYVIMFAFVEIPLVGYVVAPDWTVRTTARFNAWLDRNGHWMAVGALGLIGIYLVARGVVRLAV